MRQFLIASDYQVHGCSPVFSLEMLADKQECSVMWTRCSSSYIVFEQYIQSNEEATLSPCISCSEVHKQQGKSTFLPIDLLRVF